MPAHSPDLKGRVALVTGGSRGIGTAVPIALASAGAAVAVNAFVTDQTILVNAGVSFI